MLAFTGRPDRQAQTWDTTGFLNAWANEFGVDPPDAVISSDSEAVITINQPTLFTDDLQCESGAAHWCVELATYDELENIDLIVGCLSEE
ncbi:MAG: hypothetical protein OSA11_04690 [Candidatus Nanopelagicales bacterium]|nr:hypothetical protein [Candidatus Nanopelagicales bacterium]